MHDAEVYAANPVWRHPTQPVWINRFPATLARAEHWQAYEGAPSRRIGSEAGFASFEAALAAAQSLAS